MERPLSGDEVLVVLHSEVRCVCEEAPEQCEPPRVAALLLERQRRAADLLRIRDGGRVVADVDAHESGHGVSEHGAGIVARRLGTLGNRVGCLRGRTPVDIHHQEYGFQLECEVEPDRSQQLHRSGKERTCGPVVEAVARTPAGSGEP